MSASGKLYVTENNEPIYGIMAEFDTPADLYHAAEMVRDAGYRNWDTHTPFPIHGMEDAMGIKRTILPVLVACGGFTGATLGYLMQWWMSHDYKMVVQGKPWGHLLNGGWEPFVPIVFELGILLSAFTALFGMLAMNGLPRWHHPLLKKTGFLRSSQDKFFVAIEASDPNFDPDKTRALLERAGARVIELVEE
ncbi:MAG: DUF3341 domain-containing protein [Phycisphaerales bacterium]